jgi:hypothetical protein
MGRPTSLCVLGAAIPRPVTLKSVTLLQVLRNDKRFETFLDAYSHFHVQLNFSELRHITLASFSEQSYAPSSHDVCLQQEAPNCGVDAKFSDIEGKVKGNVDPLQKHVSNHIIAEVDASSKCTTICFPQAADFSLTEKSSIIMSGDPFLGKLGDPLSYEHVGQLLSPLATFPGFLSGKTSSAQKAGIEQCSKPAPNGFDRAVSPPVTKSMAIDRACEFLASLKWRVEDWLKVVFEGLPDETTSVLNRALCAEGFFDVHDIVFAFRQEQLTEEYLHNLGFKVGHINRFITSVKALASL